MLQSVSCGEKKISLCCGKFQQISATTAHHLFSAALTDGMATGCCQDQRCEGIGYATRSCQTTNSKDNCSLTKNNTIPHHHSKTNCCANDDTPATQPVSLLRSAPFRWRVVGMDCSSCARKVENAVLQVPGVEQVQVVFSTQKLLVNGSGDLHHAIEQAVNGAGYTLQNENQPSLSHSLIPLRQYGFIAMLTVLMVASWGISSVQHSGGRVAFILTALMGLFPVARQAWRLLRSGSWFAIESLMTVATAGALLIGATAEAAMVLLLFLIGEQLESWAANRARRGVSALVALKPETATRLAKNTTNGQIFRQQVAVQALQVGDVIEVAAGNRLPADGELLAERASFNESMLTGESLPTERLAGERVAAGVTSIDRLVMLKVVSLPGESAIDRIVKLIEEAEERRAPIERFIDQFSRIYTPAIMLLALLVALVPPLLGGDWLEWVYKALTLLLIGCPCALVISTPAAITSGLAAAARIGALVKGGATLEQLSHVRQLAFDKTGTLTEGQPQVCQIQVQADQHQPASTSTDDLLALAAAVEQGSHHPLAQAIIRHAEQRGLILATANDQRTLAGIGIEARVGDELVCLSAPGQLAEGLLSASWCDAIAALENQGQTVVVVSRNGKIAGIIGLCDTVRSDAQTALTRLHKIGVNCVMLTGDNPQAAAVIARELQLDYRAGLLPEDKVRQVDALNNVVPLAMVGDGINDAPAMKAATLGVAMGNGSDVALETADVALTHCRLNVLPTLISLARATRRNVRQNISIALGLKMLFLLTTIMGLSGLWLAVLADTGATVLVTLNALRLLAWGKHQ